MKTIGLIGGTSWISTAEYYRQINEGINKNLGGLNSGRICMFSVNYAEFKSLLDQENWQEITSYFGSIATKLESAGARCILLCAVTPHIIATELQNTLRIPIIHIGDVVAKEITIKSYKKVGILGTKFTMEESFFKERLISQGIETVIPDAADREFIQTTIFNELGKGIFKAETKEKYLEIIRKLTAQKIEAVVFACTEIPMLVTQMECPLPIIDTTLLHTAAAVSYALTD